MNPWRQTWGELNERYAAMTRRERALLAATAILGPWLIGYMLFVEPQRKQVEGLEKTLAVEAASVSRLQAELVSLQQQLASDPDAAGKAELDALHAERDRLDAQLHQLGSALVRPEEMPGLLERLLARQPGLHLVSLKTLPPRGVMSESAARGSTEKPAERAFDLYRHGVEIRLEGNFGQLEAYLVQLEGLEQRLLWGALDYRVIDHPLAEMRLTVYTLSPDRTWLAL